MDIAIRIQNVTLGYDRHPAVHHLNGVIESGALLAICGPNGAGKSTLLKAIAGTLKPLAGAIRFGGGTAPRDIAYLPQADALDRSFPIHLFDLVAMGLWRRCGLFGGFSRKDDAAIRSAIATVGLSGFESRPVGTLSGGQLQRMLFARLLVQDARLILLDEPFAAIDSKTVADLLDLIGRWHMERRTVLVVSHDLDLVRAFFPQALLIAREAIAWGKTASVLTPENLLKARAMIEAFDRQAQACERAA
ncbi:MAG TPA: ABC transporter ATP-binding protein [Methylocella sp.]|nr:ABC transporter ATP-binding protein [Methylocella sp.]